MNEAVTLSELITAVRELTFDRFIIPAFAVKQMGEHHYIHIDNTFTPEISDGEIVEMVGRMLIYSGTTVGSIEETIIDLPFNDHRSMDDIMNTLIGNGIVVAYTPYFRGEERADALIVVRDKELNDDFTAFRRYFFSDEEIKKTIIWYYHKVLHIHNVEIDDEIIGKLKRPSEKHLALWVAYHLVDKRRLYEAAAKAIGQTFTDGSDYAGSNDTSIGTVTSVQIGSVFNISEDPSTGFLYEDFNRVGSDNVWGDRYSFWYRLMVYLRDLIEQHFGDYSLRKDMVIPGQIQLDKDLNFRSYFDSYPFTLSPLSRGIISYVP